jgi:hypothetical protein
MRGLIFAIGLMAAAPAAAQTTPLFSSDEPIRVTIRGPIAAIARNAEDSTEPRDGALSLTGTAETYPIRLSARGITRRKKEVCSFPPLRVDFAQKPAASSLFASQGRLKLVTHCQSQESHQQQLLLEYSAYRIFNLLSPASFRTRLATVDYQEPNGKATATRWGFFIEDLDDVARRNGMTRAIVGERINSTQLELRQAARVALFEYMIGNLDWSMRAGPAGEACCHNSRLIGGKGSALFTSVPYDFDYSGLVDAPYAVPPEGFGIRSVRSRAYNGFCRLNAETVAAAAEFRAKRPAIEALYSQIPGMSDRTRAKARAYLAGFFNDIATDELVRTKVLKKCAA